MRLICTASLNGTLTCAGFHKGYCKCYEPHEPHEHDCNLRSYRYKCSPYYERPNYDSSKEGNDCICIPVGLEYYMKEIIKKHDGKLDEKTDM